MSASPAADPYLRLVLTVVALALVAIAVQLGASPVPVAHASDRLDCRLDGPVELRGPVEIRGIQGKVQVELSQAFGEAGSSAGRPLFVKSVD